MESLGVIGRISPQAHERKIAALSLEKPLQIPARKSDEGNHTSTAGEVMKGSQSPSPLSPRDNNTSASSSSSSASPSSSSSKNSSLARVSSSMWLNNTGDSAGLLPGRRFIGPLLLLLICPNIAVGLWWIAVVHQGCLTDAFGVGGWSSFLLNYPTPFSKDSVKILAVFFGVGLTLTRVLPCKPFKGPPSPTGYRNSYHANGTMYWLVMNVLFFVGAYTGCFRAGILYDNYGEILSSLNLIALGFCLLLYVKGRWMPSSQDCGTSGNFIFDFYHGTELYPNILGWDVKQFTNDRFGMSWWGIACLSFAGKQYELHGHVSNAMIASVVLQWVYLTKFFYWETGYFYSLDIQHDRAGFYICWGCLVWVPAVYAFSALWLVQHPMDIGLEKVIALIVFGSLMIWINYDADVQRQRFRRSNSKCKVWGKKPRFISAKFVNEHGETKDSILLASGWWGVARHFHYVPEILAALAWSPPVQWTYAVPYFYTVFLSILLIDRAFRDDARCLSKYGKFWEMYRKLVPYKMVPYVL